MGRAYALARRLRTAALVLAVVGTAMACGGGAMTVLTASDESVHKMLLGTMIAAGVLGLIVLGIALGLVRLARDVAAAPRVDPMPWGRAPSTNHVPDVADGMNGSAATWALIESMRTDHHPPTSSS